MIKLIDILNEAGESLIGPFYHETSKEAAKEILKHGLVPEQHGSSYAINSLSPAETSGMHGEVSLKIWLRPWQFEQAMEDTYNQIIQDIHRYDPREVELLELLIDSNIEEEDYQELVKRATTDPEFLAGEIVFRGTIGPEQIKVSEPLNEARQVGILYYFGPYRRLSRLIDNNFVLSSTIQPFVSFTRNKAMVSDTITSETRIAIDGDKLSQKYKITPFAHTSAGYGRGSADEAEERIDLKKYPRGIDISKAILDIQIKNPLSVGLEFDDEESFEPPSVEEYDKLIKKLKQNKIPYKLI